MRTARDPARSRQAGRITACPGSDRSGVGCLCCWREPDRRGGQTPDRFANCFPSSLRRVCGDARTRSRCSLARTDPGLVGLVFDTGHLAFGSGLDDGASVLQALDRFADRIWYVHLKDYEPGVAARSRAEGWDYFSSVRHGVFCELGKGSVNFRGVVDWLNRREYHGWVVVEQDVLPGMGTPKESAQRNREYLRVLGI